MNREDQYYIKQGRRYIPVEQWTGFPADGVWIVKGAMTSSRLVMRLGPEPLRAGDLFSEAVSRDKIYDAVCKVMMKSKNQSIDGIATAVAEELSDD